MKRWVWGLMASSALIALPALAQPASAPWSTGKLCWTWTKGSPPFDAQADRILLSCGTSPGIYDLPQKAVMIPVPPSVPPEYCMALKDLMPQPALFPANRHCKAVAALGSTQSEESIDFPFVATGPQLAVPINPRLLP